MDSRSRNEMTKKLSSAGNIFNLPKYSGPPVGHSNTSLDSMSTKQNFGYFPKTQTKPGSIKPVYGRKYRNGIPRPSSDVYNSLKIDETNSFNNSKSLNDVRTEPKEIPMSSVRGVQRQSQQDQRDETKLVNPFLDDDLHDDTSDGKDTTNIASDSYWLEVTKGPGRKSISQQQLNGNDVGTQTIRRKKDSCLIM